MVKSFTLKTRRDLVETKDQSTQVHQQWTKTQVSKFIEETPLSPPPTPQKNRKGILGLMMMLIFYLFGSFERALATLKLYVFNNGHQQWTKTQSSSIDWRNSFALKKRDFRVDDDGHLLSYWVPLRESQRELCLAPIETFFCQSNLFVFVDNTWVVSLSDSWTTIFGYEGFKFQPMLGGSLILLRTTGSWGFFFSTLEIKGNLSGSSFFFVFFSKYIQNHLNIFRIKKPLIQGFFGGPKNRRFSWKNGKNQQLRVSSLMTQFFDFLNQTSTYRSKV